METETLHVILDRVKMGDYIEVTRRNQSEKPLTTKVEGYALVDTESGAVFLDLLDGDPHAIREKGKEILSRVSEVWIRTHRDAEDSFMFWTEE